MSKPSGLNTSVYLPTHTIAVIDHVSEKCNIKKNHLVRTCMDHSLKLQYRYTNDYIDNPVTNKVRSYFIEHDQTEHKTCTYYLKSDMVNDIEWISKRVGNKRGEVIKHFLLYGLADFISKHRKELGIE